MGQDTGIQWTDATWNPTTGCTRVSEGCRNCYAFQLHDQRHAAVLAGKAVSGKQYEKPFKELQLFEDRLATPLSWRKPKRIFVNSMSDLFHKDVPDEFIVKCFAVTLLSQRHTYQILTKRPKRMRRIVGAPNFGECVYDMAFHLSHMWACGGLIDGVPEVDGPPPNCWLGTSVENQAAADERIPYLLRTPAAVRFLSCEPLLGPVDLSHFHIGWSRCPKCGRAADPDTEDPLGSEIYCRTGDECGNERPLPIDGHRLHWVIVGGESGHGARPFHLDWAKSIQNQCDAASVPVFMKQAGSNPHDWTRGDPANYEPPQLVQLRLRDRKGGDMAEWPADLRIRSFPNVNG